MTTNNRLFKFIARWVMRMEASGNVLRLALFGGTFLTTGLTALYQYGYSVYARPFIGIVFTGTLVFAYLYTELGIWNQKQRDSKDYGTNYAAPNLYMNYQMQAAQLAAFYAAINQDMDPEEFKELLPDITEEQWAQFRDGVDYEVLERADQ